MVTNKAKHYGCQYSLGLSTTLEIGATCCVACSHIYLPVGLFIYLLAFHTHDSILTKAKFTGKLPIILGDKHRESAARLFHY